MWTQYIYISYLHDVYIPLSSFFFDCKPPGEKGYSVCHEIDQIHVKKIVYKYVSYILEMCYLYLSEIL